jgi:RND family efflux transporter MFP subunit
MNTKKTPILPLCIAALVLVAGVIFFGFLRQTAQATTPPAETAAPAVAVVKVARANLAQEVTIPAEFRPYEEVELHAKVSGYVKEMKVDFGDRVKAGQLLATLEIPELEADLTNALAAEQRADADYQDTHLAWTRLEAVNGAHPNLVAQQDLDVAQARDLAAAAAVAGARADVQKYRATVDYSRITAPFDGVITMRSADPGALIQAGTAANPEAKSLLHISDNYLLRLDFPVSVAYVQDVHAGDPVAVRVESLGGRTFTGTITRFTDQVDESTRTMMTEIEVPNNDLELVPGMYCTVMLQVNRRPAALAVPTAAVVSDKNPQVYVVNQNDQLEARAVKLGVETPDQYEILDGLREGELVVIGNHAEVHAGQTVQPRLQAALTLNQ